MFKVRLAASIMLLALLGSNMGIVALSKSTENNMLKPTVMYETIMYKPIDDVLNDLIPLNPKFIFRGYFKWDAKPDDMVELADRIRQIKAVLPDVIFQAAIPCGAIRAEYLLANGSSIDPVIFDSMILHDPEGNKVPFGGLHYGMYVADIASPTLREYLLDWVEKMIDAGADAVFFDTVYWAATSRIFQFGEDFDKVFDEYDGYWKIIRDATKEYGRSKGKEILVGVNCAQILAEIRVHPYQDIVVVAGLPWNVANFSDGGEQSWNRIKENTLKSMGKPVPIVMFLDTALHSYTALGIFASLNVSDQIKYLEIVHDSSEANGYIFNWPVYGGFLGFGSGLYDSKSYGTYDTIKTLIEAIPSARPISISELNFVDSQEGSVYFIYPDYQGSKPPGIRYALVSDWTAAGYIAGICSNRQNEATDTNQLVIDHSDGKVMLQNKSVILFGGPIVNAPVNYYEKNRIALLYYKSENDKGYWFLRDGTRIDETEITPNSKSDMFVVEAFMDDNGNKILIVYGYGWKGTFAGGKFFKFVIQPNIDNYTGSYYIFKWNDSNSNDFVELNEISTTPVASETS